MTDRTNDADRHAFVYDDADVLWVLAMLQSAEAEAFCMGTAEARKTRDRIAQKRAEVARTIPCPILDPAMPYAWYAILTAAQSCTRYAVRLDGASWSRSRDIVVTLDGRDHVLVRGHPEAEAHLSTIEAIVSRVAPLSARRATA